MTDWMRWLGGTVVTAALAAGAGLPVSAEEAADYPSRQVTILAPFTAGGPADLFTRVQAEMLEQKYGVPFIVENVPGAGGVVAAKALAQRPADGYTWFSASSGLLTIMPSLPDAAVHPLEDFEMLGMIRTQPLLVVVLEDSRYETIEDVLDEARARPGEVSYASIGVNSLMHLAGELLSSEADVSLLHVPYPGSSQYMVDLLAGRIDMAISTPGTLASYPGQVRALIQAQNTRSPFAPGVPSNQEAGLPGFDLESWTAMVVAKGTPEPIVAKAIEMLREVDADPDFQSRLQNLDAQPKFISGPDFQAEYEDQIRRRGEAIRSSGL